MQRVRLIFFMRSMSRPFLVEAAVVGGAFVLLSMLVSFGNIYTNAEGMLATGSFLQYLLSAVLHTEWRVQVLLGASTLASLYFFYEAVRKVRLARRSFGFSK